MKNNILDEQIEQAISFWTENSLDMVEYILLLPHDNWPKNEVITQMFYDRLDGRLGVVIHGENAQLLIDLYSCYSFTDKIIIGSFSKPSGRKLFNLLNCGIATEEELINDVLLGAM